MSAALETWIREHVALIPGANDDLFNRLWNQHRLEYEGCKSDEVDELSARIVCGALRAGRSTCIILPDSTPRRSAFLFATALLRYWRDSHNATGQSLAPVLYYGSHIGIREQMASCFVGNNLRLASVFVQSHQSIHCTSIRQDSTTRSPRDSLPRVLTVYSPADPVEICRRTRPSWVAVDLGEADRMDWLPTLVQFAEKSKITVLAWGSNHLCLSVQELRASFHLVTWPNLPVCNGNAHVGLGSTFATTVQPFVLHGSNVTAIGERVKEAARLLGSCVRQASGKLTRDALDFVRRYVYAIDGSPLPIGYYEAHCQSVWGAPSLKAMRDACEKFLEQCTATHAPIAPTLWKALLLADKALNELRADNPLWNGTCQELLRDKDGDRLFVFSSLAKRQLFARCLLDQCGVSEEDLKELRVGFASLGELGKHGSFDTPSQESRHATQVIFVGLPAIHSGIRIQNLLQHPKVSMIVYPHQLHALNCRVRTWSEKLTGDIVSVGDCVARLCGSSAPQVQVHPSSRVASGHPHNIDVDSAERVACKQLLNMPAVGSLEAELEWLYGGDGISSVDDECQDAHVPLLLAQGQSDRPWCDVAVELTFVGGGRMLFAPDDELNVVERTPHGPKTREIPAKDVSDGQLLVIIHGQRRQSFYDLLVSRLHQHESVAFWLTLVRRWPQEVRLALQSYATGANNKIQQLLKDLQAHGSTISTETTVRLWIAGKCLSPEDPHDLDRLGAILGLPFLQKHSDAIAHAATRISGLHISLALRLSHWLERELSGADTQNDDDVIDETFGLTFADLRSSLLLLRIANRTPVQGPILRSRLGKLEKS